MSRVAKGRVPRGEVMVRRGKRGEVFAIRFRAGGRRYYVTLGAAPEWTHERAAQELLNVQAQVRLGIWKPPG